MASVSAFSFGGQTPSATTTERDIFLRKFAGEVLTNYYQMNVADPLVTTRRISSGKSAQFPVTGTASAAYFTPGQDILVDGSYLNDIATNERLIKLDRLLIAPVFIDSVDEAMSHYDYRTPFTQSLASALAEHKDDALFRQIIIASTSPAVSPQAGGGGDIGLGGTVAAASTQTMMNAFFEAAQKFDESNAPQWGRHAVLSPEAYYKLINDGTATLVTAVNKDVGGNGSITSGKVYELAGIRIHKSNHFVGLDDDPGPIANFTGLNAAGSEDDHGDYSYDLGDGTGDTAGVFFHSSAIGQVVMKDLTVESEYIIERQGDLVVAKMMFGADVLRPDMAMRLAQA